MTGPDPKPLAVSLTALGSFGLFVGGDSPFAVGTPALDSSVARVALDGLLARGLVVLGDDGLHPGPELQSVLEVAAAADDVLAVDVDKAKTVWLLAGQAAVEQRISTSGNCAIEVIGAAEALSRAAAAVTPPGTSVLDPVGSATVDTALLRSAVRLAEDGKDLPAGLPPLVQTFVVALTGETRHCAIDRRARHPNGLVTGFRSEWIDAGQDGCWALAASGEQTTVRRLDPTEIVLEIGQLASHDFHPEPASA